MEFCRDQLKGVHMAMTGSMQRRRSTRGSSGGWEEPGRSFHDALAWITQQKVQTQKHRNPVCALNITGSRCLKQCGLDFL